MITKANVCRGWNDRQLVAITTIGGVFAPMPVYWWSSTTALVFTSIFVSNGGDGYHYCTIDSSTWAYCWVSCLCGGPKATYGGKYLTVCHA